MAEIDPVILELRAEMGRYRADLKSSTALVSQQLGRQEKAVQRLEAQMRKSSGAIGDSLRGIAATLGTYFTGRELTGMIDSFTRLQNSLKVAGLEGQNLERVQRDLLDLSTRYGVGIEGLANLYGKASDAGKSFGASEAQVLQLTEATSQALKITGTSAVQAQGAILGLSQALASGTVRAEEYNQINEGGLRPLLQAAAASEKYGGDINKLRKAMLDGKVSSQEFFSGILAGSAQLEGQASKATLTLSGAFEGLTSRLTVYIGQSAQANGVTAALAGAMQLLAENLDTVIPALALIGTALGVGFVTNAIRARVAAIAAAGGMTTLAGAARGALAVLGGPIGIAITAVSVGLGILATQSSVTSRSLQDFEGELATAEGRLDDARKQAKAAGVNIDGLKKSSDAATGSFSSFTSAVWAGVDAMTSAAKAAKDLTLAKIALSTAEARAAIPELSLRASLQAEAIRIGKRTGSPVSQQFIADTNENSAKLNVLAATIRANEETAAIVNALGSKFKEPGGSVATGAGGSGDKKKVRSSGASGPSAEAIERKFFDELTSLDQQTLSARQALATSAEERAELEIRSVELARRNALESLKAEKGYSDEQKARIAERLDKIASLEAERIEREKRIRLAEEAADLADAQFRAESDALRQQYDLAKSQAERRRLAFEIIDLEYRERDAALERIKNNEDLADAVRQRAAIEQAALRAAQGRTMEQARRDTAGPLENYFDRAKMDAAELNEAYESIAVDGLQSLNDGLADAIVNSKSLGDVFKNVAKQIIADLIRIAIQQTIVNALTGGAGGAGGGGGIGAVVGSIFGRASGGYVAPGQTVRVNEQRGGAEYLRMGSQGGTVIPLGQVNQSAAKPAGNGDGVVRIMIEEAPGFASTVRAEATGAAIEVVRVTSPTVINAAAQETQRRMSRPRMPGAGR